MSLTRIILTGLRRTSPGKQQTENRTDGDADWHSEKWIDQWSKVARHGLRCKYRRPEEANGEPDSSENGRTNGGVTNPMSVLRSMSDKRIPATDEDATNGNDAERRDDRPNLDTPDEHHERCGKYNGTIITS